MFGMAPPRPPPREPSPEPVEAATEEPVEDEPDVEEGVAPPPPPPRTRPPPSMPVPAAPVVPDEVEEDDDDEPERALPPPPPPSRPAGGFGTRSREASTDPEYDPSSPPPRPPSRTVASPSPVSLPQLQSEPFTVPDFDDAPRSPPPPPSHDRPLPSGARQASLGHDETAQTSPIGGGSGSFDSVGPATQSFSAVDQARLDALSDRIGAQSASSAEAGAR